MRGVCTNVDPCTFLSWFLAMTIVSRRVSVKVRKNYLAGNDPEPGNSDEDCGPFGLCWP